MLKEPPGEATPLAGGSSETEDKAFFSTSTGAEIFVTGTLCALSTWFSFVILDSQGMLWTRDGMHVVLPLACVSASVKVACSVHTLAALLRQRSGAGKSCRPCTLKECTLKVVLRLCSHIAASVTLGLVFFWLALTIARELNPYAREGVDSRLWSREGAAAAGEPVSAIPAGGGGSDGGVARASGTDGGASWMEKKLKRAVEEAQEGGVVTSGEADVGEERPRARGLELVVHSDHRRRVQRVLPLQVLQKVGQQLVRLVLARGLQQRREDAAHVGLRDVRLGGLHRRRGRDKALSGDAPVVGGRRPRQGIRCSSRDAAWAMGIVVCRVLYALCLCCLCWVCSYTKILGN